MRVLNMFAYVAIYLYLSSFCHVVYVCVCFVCVFLTEIIKKLHSYLSVFDTHCVIS